MGVALDMSEYISSKSKHLTVEDFIGGPRVLQIRSAEPTGDDDRPVAIFFEGEPLVFLPSKTVRRVLMRIWPDASKEAGKQYPGRWLRLYVDPEVSFGTEKTGGIRVNGASHIDGVQTGTLPAGRNKRSPWRIEPLRIEQPPTTPPPASWPSDEDRIAFTDALDGCTMAEVEAVLQRARKPHPAAMTPEQRAQILEWLASDAGRSAIEKVRHG